MIFHILLQVESTFPRTNSKAHRKMATNEFVQRLQPTELIPPSWQQSTRQPHQE